MGLPVNLNGKSINHFLKVNATTEMKFDGSNSVSFQCYWNQLLPIHLAPEAQISYHRKVGGMLYLLGGDAKTALQDFHTVDTQDGYFKLWRLIYEAYGIRRLTGTWLNTYMAEKGHVLCTDVKTYLLGLLSALDQHQKNGESLDSLAMKAWAPLQELLRRDFGDFCETWPNFRTLHRTYDNLVASDPYGTLTEFVSFMIMRIENREKSSGSGSMDYRIMRTIMKKNQKEKQSCTLSTDEESSDSEPETPVKVERNQSVQQGTKRKAETVESQASAPEATTPKAKKRKNRNKNKNSAQGQETPKENQGHQDQGGLHGVKVIGAKQGPQGKGKGANNPLQAIVRVCPFKCGGNHAAVNCTVLTRGQRITYIERNNGCLNCLSPTHRVDQCYSKMSCLDCTKRGIPKDQCRHHTSTCPNLFDKSGKYFGKGSDYYDQGKKRRYPDSAQPGQGSNEPVNPKVESAQGGEEAPPAKMQKTEQPGKIF
jgi:hypothetical protein